MKKNIILSTLLMLIVAIFLNIFSASQQHSVAAASITTIIILYLILKNKLSKSIDRYIFNFKEWIANLNLQKNEALKSLENAINKEYNTEKKIDEIAHHAHNNIQFLKKNSQEQIVIFKKRTGDNFAMNAHAQKTQCNEEIKFYFINQLKDQLHKFFTTKNMKNNKNNIKNSLDKLEDILNQ